MADHSVKTRKKLHPTDYRVAWFAPASDVELLPARLMLDEEHDDPDYDAAFDDNSYICGEILNHNVVIAVSATSLTGNVNSSLIADSLFKTFQNINMALIVGIGGGIPRAIQSPQAANNIHVGDVVVGWTTDGSPHCVYFESGRRHVASFDTLATINRPDRILLNALARLKSDYQFRQTEFQSHQQRLLQSQHRSLFEYPGRQTDRLFQADYCHEGQYNDKCVSCNNLKLVMRPTRSEEEAGRIVFHQGTIATGNSVIMDGVARDKIRDQCYGAICVEMEAAGVDAAKPCLVIRGISDYADSHKSDDWRSYAAGNAAVFARGLLSKVKARKPAIPHTQAKVPAPMCLPFSRNKNFVGRETDMEELLKVVPPLTQPNACQRTVISGLGGIGKTQVVIELAYRARENDTDMAVYWVPAVNETLFESACEDIAKAHKADLNLSAKDEIKRLLSGDQKHRWLLILDNLDDLTTFEKLDIWGWLPFSRAGSIVVTTRNSQIATGLDANDRFQLRELDPQDGRKLLHHGLQPHQIGKPADTSRLLGFLIHLPLAIRQASAFLSRSPLLTVGDYLKNCQYKDERTIEMLSMGFNDQGRYNLSNNPVATTWLVSFTELLNTEPLAADCLQNIAFFKKDVPLELLPGREGDQARRLAAGVLCSYGFVEFQDDIQVCRVHRLVSLVMRNWLRSKGQHTHQLNQIIRRLVDEYDWSSLSSVWERFAPHVWDIMVMHIDASETQDGLDQASREDSSKRAKQNFAQGQHGDSDDAYCNKLFHIWSTMRAVQSPKRYEPDPRPRKRMIPTLVTSEASAFTEWKLAE